MDPGQYAERAYGDRRCRHGNPQSSGSVGDRLSFGPGNAVHREAVRQGLKDHRLTASMGAVGRSAKNAPAEGFFGLIKRELRDICRDDTRQQANSRIND